MATNPRSIKELEPQSSKIELAHSDHNPSSYDKDTTPSRKEKTKGLLLNCINPISSFPDDKAPFSKKLLSIPVVAAKTALLFTTVITACNIALFSIFATASLIGSTTGGFATTTMFQVSTSLITTFSSICLAGAIGSITLGAIGRVFNKPNGELGIILGSSIGAIAGFPAISPVLEPSEQFMEPKIEIIEKTHQKIYNIFNENAVSKTDENVYILRPQQSLKQKTQILKYHA